MKRGRFIVIDGIDGSGKSTQVKMLKKAYPKAVFTHDPGGTAAGERMREMLLSAKKLPPLSTLFLFFAAKAALVEEVIEPALTKGKTVISDRFDSSTYAYQVVAGKHTAFKPLIEAFEKHILRNARPDLYIILDADPKEARKRLAKKGNLNVYDKKPPAYHAAVRRGFKTFRPRGSTVVIVNADRSREEVFREIRGLVEHLS